MDRTFIAVKPDGVQRGLVGEIVRRLENRGYRLVGLKMMLVPRETAEEHYGEHREKPFFAGLVDFITSGPIVAMVWEGKDVVAASRTLIGKTNPQDASPGTIRGDFALDVGRNLVHGSDSLESAKREIGIFFQNQELVSWEQTLKPWINESRR